jgi:hypothetical protein
VLKVARNKEGAVDKTIPIEARAEHKDGRYHAFARMTDERGTRCARADASTYQESVHRAITKLQDEPGETPQRSRVRRAIARAIQHQVAN